MMQNLLSSPPIKELYHRQQLIRPFSIADYRLENDRIKKI
jgi:hypothetical protein